MTELTRDRCFEAGWQLLSPDTWEYCDIFTGTRGIATVEGLQAALKAKAERLSRKNIEVSKSIKTTRKSKK